MADEIVEQSVVQENKTTNTPVARTGQRGTFKFSSVSNNENPVATKEDAVVEQPAQQQAAQPAESQSPVNKSEQEALTPAQLRDYFKSIGINFDGNPEILKEKFKPQSTQPSEEEKLAAQKAEEKELLDLYLENGGTIDQFTSIKGIITSDDGELSRTATVKELMDAGFSKSEAEAEVAHLYYFNSVEDLKNLNREDFDTDEEFAAEKARLQKKVDVGAKRFSNKSIDIKQQAKKFFEGLKDTLKTRKAQKQEEVSYSSKVDEHFNTMPREMLLELGERNGQKLDPIKFVVAESEINAAKELMRDPAKRKQFFLNEDGSLNIDNASKLLVAYYSINPVAKKLFLEGESKNTAQFRSMFPATTAYEVGVGGSQHKKVTDGKIVAAGPAKKATNQQIRR